MNNITKQLISFILPITAIIIIPLSINEINSVPYISTLIIGIVIICVGFYAMVLTIFSFIKKGEGTLAPWSPPKKLVTTGLYSHFRNPMISGVMTVLIGESIAILSLNIFLWAIIFFIINNIYFIVYEEPNLEKRFGDEYRKYKKNVPRWIPKRKPVIID